MLAGAVKSWTSPQLRADEVMMVMPGEILGQLVAGELVAADDPVDHAGLFEDGQVPVRRRLGQRPVACEQLRDRQWRLGRGQHPHQRAAGPGIALVEPPQAGRRLVVQVETPPS